MKESDFVYWLQGFVELSDTDTISEKQWLMIKDHLKLVFDKKTPDRTDFNPVRIPSLTERLADPSYWQIKDQPYFTTVTC